MRPLIKVLAIIVTVFVMTFMVIRITGLLTTDQIEGWLIHAKHASPVYLGSTVVVLLFADLFIAVPTLTVIILSGYFLGNVYGSIAAICGTMLAGISGYAISRYYGNRIMTLLIEDKEKRRDAISAFEKNGFAMILLSRAVPILPEATACLAGMTKMRFWKFMLAWSASTVPYALIATYAGSVSSVSNPKPAIFAALLMSAVLWCSWFFYQRFNNGKDE